MQFDTHGQWWSNVCVCQIGCWENRSVSAKPSISTRRRILPQYSDCTRNNGSIVAVDRIYMLRTTSCELWCHWFLHSCRVALETRLLGLHRAVLIMQWTNTSNTVSIGEMSTQITFNIVLAHLWESRLDPWTLRARSWQWRRMWGHLVSLEHMDVWASNSGSWREERDKGGVELALQQTR